MIAHPESLTTDLRPSYHDLRSYQTRLNSLLASSIRSGKDCSLPGVKGRRGFTRINVTATQGIVHHDLTRVERIDG